MSNVSSVWCRSPGALIKVAGCRERCRTAAAFGMSFVMSDAAGGMTAILPALNTMDDDVLHFLVQLLASHRQLLTFSLTCKHFNGARAAGRSPEDSRHSPANC